MLPTTRRFRALLDYLGIDQATFARETGMSEGAVSRLFSGERGKRISGDLIWFTNRTYGVEERYWKSKTDLSPQACGARPKVAVQADMSTHGGALERSEIRAVDTQYVLARALARNEESPAVVSGLLSTYPPADADLEWWIVKWLELRREVAEKGMHDLP